MSAALRQMTAEEFSRRLRIMCDHPDSRFAFFIGAGCSVSSGIPAAGPLVKQHWLPRLRDLRAPQRQDLDTWAAEQFTGYDPANPAGAYGAVMNELFLLPEERQREIERLCDGRFPGFGYAALASLMALDNGKFNVALTTNFDDLIAEALYLFTKVKPMVIPHESLGNYLRPTRTRPLVVKLHGDYNLAPLNTQRLVQEVVEDVEKRVRSVIRDRGLIFIGYGGQDEWMARLFSAFTEEALPLGVYWVSESEPQGVVRSWLESRQAVWVEKRDFDEFMLLLRNIFTAPHPDSKRFEHVFAKYASTYQALSNRIAMLPEAGAGVAALREAIKTTGESFPDWWSVELEAEHLKHADPVKADAVYVRGLEKFPNSGALLNSYANFLRDIRKDNIRSEENYQKALAADPNNLDILQNYAFFLARIRKDYDKAEDLYSRALSLDGNNARLIATFASFLAKMRRDLRRAEENYRRALAADPADPYTVASYAGFLLSQGRETEGMAELNKVLPQASLEDTPNLALECWFYLLANGPTEVRAQTLSDLKKVLTAGRRRPGLVLTPNITRARQTSHADSPWLEKLALVIADEANLDILNDWPGWKNA
jgi:protein O-mannosyl-transferase